MSKLLQTYFTHLYPFLIYGVTAWGNTYKSTLTPIINLQKRVIRIITFSNYNDHSNPLFKALEIIKFEDIIFLHNGIFITDDEQINSRFDLAFYYYLVSYYTNCVQHSSDKIAKCEFTTLH